MSTAPEDLAPFLRPTAYIDSDSAPIEELAEALRKPQPRETSIALFDEVRDRIRYDPFAAMDPPESYRASAILARGSGYCIQKAVLLAALGRAADIPTRLGFADVRNHKVSPRLREAMGTDLFVFHGYVEFHIEGAWLKATPAFDAETSRRIGVLPLELDGIGDAMFHPVDPQGAPFMDYVQDRGTYADLPLEEIVATFTEVYADSLLTRDTEDEG